MPEPLVEELVLDISPALSSIGLVDDALTGVLTSFSSGFVDAFSTFTDQVGQPVTVAIDADASAAEAAVAQIADPQTVPVDADTGAAAGEIDALDTAPVTVSVGAETGDAKEAIDSLAGDTVIVSVDADTTAADDALSSLGDTATEATGSGTGGTGLAGLEGAAVGLQAATGAAVGEVSSLAGAVGGLSSQTGLAVGGLTAFGAFITTAVRQAADEETQLRRFNQTFGDLAEQVRNISVGGLVTTLDQLGVVSGTTSEDLNAVASRIGQLGASVGASDEQIVSTTQNLLALGATFSVNNPRLGDAADVTDRLTNAFARGGRALAPFGLALSAAQINAEALRETGKASAADLTLFEKAAAGANLALDKFGATLGTRFAEGAQNAETRFRALKTQVTEALDVIGAPLLEPAVESMTALVPVAIEVGQVIGSVAQIVLPFVAALAPGLAAVAGPLGLVADGLDLIATGVQALPAPALIGIAAGITAIGIAAGAADGLIVAFTTGIAGVNPVVAGVVVGLAVLGAAVRLFGEEESAASQESKDLSEALFDTGAKARAFATGLTSAAAGLTQFLTKQDADGKLKDLQASLEGTGVTLRDVGEAVAGTADEFEALKGSLTDTTGLTELQRRFLGLSDDLVDFRATSAGLTQTQIAQVKAINQTTRSLDQQRDAFVQSAEQELQFLGRSGKLSESQLAQAEATAHATTGVRGYGAALDQANAAVERNAAAQAAAAVTAADQAGAFAQLRTELAAGATSTEEATQRLLDLGVSADDAKTFIDGVTGAVKDFISGAVSALPDAGSRVDEFEQGVKSAFEQVATDVHDKTGSVKDDLASLKKALDPAEFIKGLFADAATVKQFTQDLRTLGEEGFTGLVAVFAEKGPAASANAAHLFASDKNQAAWAEAGVDVGVAAKQGLADELQRQAPALVGASTELGNTLGTSIEAGFQPNLADASDEAVTKAGTAIDAKAAFLAERARLLAGRAHVDYRGELDFTPATTEAVSKAAGAVDADTALPTAAKQHGERATTSFAAALDPAEEASQKFQQTAGAIAQTQLGLISVSQNVGFVVGLAFTTGIASGINAGVPIIQGAATAAALQAGAAARTALGVKSPSTVGIDIGKQFVAGIAVGLSDTTPLVSAASAVGDAIALAATPTLPSFVIPVASAISGASSGPSSLALDLTINLPGGDTVIVKDVQVPIPPGPSRLLQRVRAEVQAG